MQFAMSLVDNGAISCEELFEALKLQMHSRPQLGALAIETRRLTCRQVFAILRAQCDEPDVLFGELAVRLGYLTDDDLQQLLVEQAARATPLADVLIDHGFLSSEVVELHYAEYRRCLQNDQQQLVAAGV